MPNISKGLKQSYDIQNFAHESLMAIKDKLTTNGGKVKSPDPEAVQAISALARVWQSAQERIQVHRGKPNPGSLRHSTAGPKLNPWWAKADERKPASTLPAPDSAPAPAPSSDQE